MDFVEEILYGLKKLQTLPKRPHRGRFRGEDALWDKFLKFESQTELHPTTTCIYLEITTLSGQLGELCRIFGSILNSTFCLLTPDTGRRGQIRVAGSCSFSFAFHAVWAFVIYEGEGGGLRFYRKSWRIKVLGTSDCHCSNRTKVFRRPAASSATCTGLFMWSGKNFG